jgi:outer membrane protein assembly factor BamD (BamD/ComL family)
MSSRLLISMFIVLMLLCFAAPMYAQSAPQPAANTPISNAFAQAKAADKANHPDQAAQILWSIADRFPNHPEAPRAAKQAAYATDKLKDRDQSIAAFKKALALYPNSQFVPALKRCLALNYQAKGDKDSAIAELKDLVARFPKHEEASEGLVNLGLLYTSQVGMNDSDAANWKRKDAADAAFKQLVDTFPNKRQLCAKAEMYRAGIAFEKVLAKRSTWDVASDQLQGVLDTYPDAPPAVRARCEIMLAEIAVKTGDTRGMADRAEKIIRSYPKCKLEVAWAHFLAGDACECEKRYSEALAHYTAILAGKYTKADNFKGIDITLFSLRRLGQVYTNLGMTKEAIADWQTLIKSYPGTGEAAFASESLSALGGSN